MFNYKPISPTTISLIGYVSDLCTAERVVTHTIDVFGGTDEMEMSGVNDVNTT